MSVKASRAERDAPFRLADLPVELLGHIARFVLDCEGDVYERQYVRLFDLGLISKQFHAIATHLDRHLLGLTPLGICLLRSNPNLDRVTTLALYLSVRSNKRLVYASLTKLF